MNDRINSEDERDVNEDNNGGDIPGVRPAGDQSVIGPRRDTYRMDSDTPVQPTQPQYAIAINLDEIPIAQMVNGPLNDDADGLLYDIVEPTAQIQDNDAEIQWDEIQIAQIAALPIDEENDGPWANPAIRL